jgi:hypothetical protein
VNREATEQRNALIGHGDDAYRSGVYAAESRIRLDSIAAKFSAQIGSRLRDSS